MRERDPDGRLVISYLSLRTAVGLIGIALPFVLALGGLVIEGAGIRGSVSAYYHSTMGDVFVGSLCAIGVFFYCYRIDNVTGNLAGVFAIGTALFPVAAEAGEPRGVSFPALHVVFAGLFFLTLAYFCLDLFRRTDERSVLFRRVDETPMTPQKVRRNRVYTACGVTILTCLVLIAAVSWLADDSGAIQRLDPVFWLEATAIVAFGLSWCTKGQAILGDEGPADERAGPLAAEARPGRAR